MLSVRTVLCLFSAIGTAAAGTLYSNGAPSPASGNELSGYIQVDDFTLGSPSTLTGARFWGFYFSDLGNGYLGSITWQIYDGSGAEPGSLLYSGVAWPALSAGAFNCCDGDAIQLDLSLPSIELQAGTYWLGLHNGDLSDTAVEYFYWQTAADNATSRGFEQGLPFGNGAWSGTGLDHAFELSGPSEETPEPASVILVGMGVGLTFLRRWGGCSFYK